MLCYSLFLDLFGVKSHMSAVDAFTVIISHPVGQKVICFEKNPL